MSFWTYWGSFRPIEAVVISVMLLLALSAVERSRTSRTNKYLLTANWSVVIALFLSLKPIYEMADPLIGGHNFTNLLQRALVAYAGFAVTYSLAQMTRKIFKEEERPLCMSRVWLVLSLVGIAASFVAMGAAESTSRGLAGYSGHYIAFTLYQCSTLIGLLAGSHYLVPRLWRIAGDSDDAKLKMELRIFVASYLSAAMAALLFVLSPVSPVVVGFREFFIYLTFASLAVGFMLINRERRSLSAKSGRLQRA